MNDNDRIYDSNISVVIRQKIKTIDGIILISLCFMYLLLTIFPEFAVTAFGRKGFLNSVSESRLVFFMMPLLLLSEYFWFSLNNGNKYLTSLILFTTSLIPVFNIFK